MGINVGINASARGRQFLYIAMGAAVALTPVTVAAIGSPDTAPRVLADCNDVVDTTDSFSMDCVPTVMPDVSDQLTEAEVALPGFNAVPGGSAEGGGGHDGGGGHGR